MQFNPSITEDIGLLCNKRLNEEDFVVVSNNGRDWVGDGHLLWGYDSMTWVYNNTNDEIVLHYTPSFPGYLYLDDETDERFNEKYGQWIKKYEPIFTKIVPNNVAKKWLNLTEHILKQIEKNSR